MALNYNLHFRIKRIKDNLSSSKYNVFLIYGEDKNLIRFFSKYNKLEIKFYNSESMWKTYYIEE